MKQSFFQILQQISGNYIFFKKRIAGHHALVSRYRFAVPKVFGCFPLPCVTLSFFVAPAAAAADAAAAAAAAAADDDDDAMHPQ